MRVGSVGIDKKFINAKLSKQAQRDQAKLEHLQGQVCSEALMMQKMEAIFNIKGC